MLVGGRVKDHLYAVGMKYLLHAVRIGYVSHGKQNLISESPLRQLLLQIKHWRFSLIDADQLGWTELENLSTQLLSDRTGGSSYQHHLIC